MADRTYLGADEKKQMIECMYVLDCSAKNDVFSGHKLFQVHVHVHT